MEHKEKPPRLATAAVMGLPNSASQSLFNSLLAIVQLLAGPRPIWAAGEIVRFPRPFRPPDAHQSRDRFVTVRPDGAGDWCASEVDEGGATLVRGLTKREALSWALAWVLEHNAELQVSNAPLDERRRA
jgi:hypothetical protein